MPSDAEMVAYAKRLPPIYRDVMAAFPAIESTRKAGYGLAFQTLAVHFANNGRGYSTLGHSPEPATAAKRRRTRYNGSYANRFHPAHRPPHVP